MKEKNILIIGNGFDLALKRKTKYEDFIKFACQIVGFPDRDKKYIRAPLKTSQKTYKMR